MRYSISLLFATVLSAQISPFSQPVATDDGQAVYFLSPLLLKTAPDPVPSKGGSNSSVQNLYRLGQNGFELLSASATTPQVSGDGSIVGYTDPNVCVTTGQSTSCGRKAMLLGPSAVDLGSGTLQLSRNGRWAVVGGFPSPLVPAETAGVPGLLEELAPSTPYLNLQPSPAAGSYTELLGTLNGTVESLTGKVLLGGVPLVILAVKPGEVDVQIPWEAPVGNQRFQVLTPSTSPFKQDQFIFTSNFGPRYFPLPAGQTSVLGPVPLIRGDFSGFQTTQPQAEDTWCFTWQGWGRCWVHPCPGVPLP